MTVERIVAFGEDAMPVPISQFVNHQGVAPQHVRIDLADVPTSVELNICCPVGGCPSRFPNQGALARHLRWKHEGDRCVVVCCG